MKIKHWFRRSGNEASLGSRGSQDERNKRRGASPSAARRARGGTVGSTRGVVTPHAFDKAIFTWRAPEYAHHEKSPLWFLIAGLIALALVIYGLETDGWTFSVAVIVFAGTYYLIQRHRPQIVEVKISKFGVKIGRHVFPYSHLKNFWIVYDPPFIKKLYLRMAGAFQPDVFVALEDGDPVEIRRILSAHLTELRGRHEPFSDTLVRLFKL